LPSGVVAKLALPELGRTSSATTGITVKYRKNIRLKHYDYSADGFYFVTVCTNYYAPIIHKNERQLIQQMLETLPSQFKGVKVDTHVISSIYYQQPFGFKTENGGILC